MAASDARALLYPSEAYMPNFSLAVC